MSIFSRNLSHHWNCKEIKTKYLENIGHNILELCRLLVQINYSQIKGNLISSIANVVHKLPHWLPNDLRLRNLGNKAILGKFQL